MASIFQVASNVKKQSPEVFYNTNVLKIPQNSQESTCVGFCFKKRDSDTSVFLRISRNIQHFLQNTSTEFLTEVNGSIEKYMLKVNNKNTRLTHLRPMFYSVFYVIFRSYRNQTINLHINSSTSFCF